MGDWIIRDVRQDEAARLAQLMRDLFVAAYPHCSTPRNIAAFLDAAYGQAQQCAELDDASIDTVVVECGTEWLGFAQLRFGKPAPAGVTLDHGAELGRIYLDPRAQGRGLGRALLRELERRTLARGRDGLWLNVWQEAPQALAFYAREGFERCGVTQFVVGDDAKTDWRMFKRLEPRFDALPAPLAERLAAIRARVAADTRFEALLVAGSVAAGQADAWSDLDLVVVCTREAWPGVLDARHGFAATCGPLLAAFTGEHVGEPRLLICLYGPPLVHVDFKFVTVQALAERVDELRVLVDKTGVAWRVLSDSRARYPAPDLDWIEARFWTWIHYGATKIGRGETLEACEMLGFLRWRVLGPLALQSVGATPNGVRRIENAAPSWAARLGSTYVAAQPRATALALREAASIYRELRGAWQATAAEAESLCYLEEVIAGIG